MSVLSTFENLYKILKKYGILSRMIKENAL